MACVHRSLRSKEASISRLRRELVSLFGREMVEQASRTDPADLEVSAALMDTVHDAADKLLASSYRPSLQRDIVAGLDPQARLLLCMWLSDLGLAATLMAMALEAA